MKYLNLLLALTVTTSLAHAQTKPVAPAKPPATPTPIAASQPATAPAKDKVVVDAATEKVLKGAQKYLAGQQTPAGSWTSRGAEHPVAMTGYALMALLACGQLPGEGEYGKQVTAGTNYLLSCVREDGYITSESVRTGRKASNMYDHGVATIALAEVYGQTQDPQIKQKLELAVKLIQRAQNKQGGWRYTPRPESADISVSVLQVVALRAAKNGGIIIPQETIDRAVSYIRSCHDPRTGGFAYQPGSGAGFARTAAAIYSLQVCGLYDDPLVLKASDYLNKHKSEKSWYTYGHFYAAPAQYMIGGKTWEDWYAHMRTTLMAKAISQGDIAYWKDIEGQGLGDAYATSVYTMILAMPYHYVPLYQR
jgi:prenyltransferase beta subunit